MKLNELKDNAGARQNRTRIGRGPGSGTGRTGGRGMKGQKSRSGVAIKGFEGGQMPIHRRLPKRGFTNIFRKTYVLANLGRIQKAIDDKKLDAAKPVNAETLHAAGVIGSAKKNVKLLGKGTLKAKLTIEVAVASAAAISAVEKAGGKVTVTFDKVAEEERKAAKADQRRAKSKKGKKAAKAAAAPKAKAGDKAKPAKEEVKAEAKEAAPEAKAEAKDAKAKDKE